MRVDPSFNVIKYFDNAAVPTLEARTETRPNAQPSPPIDRVAASATGFLRFSTTSNCSDSLVRISHFPCSVVNARTADGSSGRNGGTRRNLPPTAALQLSMLFCPDSATKRAGTNDDSAYNAEQPLLS